MKSISILLLWGLLIVSAPHASWAQSPYSPSEGNAEAGHDTSLNQYRRRYFYGDDGKISTAKLDRLIKFLQHQKSLLMDSAKLNRKVELIHEHGYDNDKAEKEGLEAQGPEAEAIAPFNFAIEHTEALRQNYPHMNASQIHEKVELILLFLAAGYTPYPQTLLTNPINRVKNLTENFFEFTIDDRDKLQASNLLLHGRFATQKDLKEFRRSGGDLSQLNPPSSAIWTDNDVASYDPAAEIYWGRKFFPPRDLELPVFYYKRMGNGTIKFKTHWLDENDLNKKGLPKKKDVTLRAGFEAYTASVVNHLARIVGYPANPTTFRPLIKLELGDVGFEEFTVQWRQAHGLELGSPLTHIERLPGENAVLLKNVTLEAYPDKDDYRRMGPFRMGHNGLRNRREYRAMVLYNSLISLQDQFEYQSRVDAIRDPQRGWLPLFLISDSSAAMGLPTFGNVGTVNEYTWEFTRRNSGEVQLFWLSLFHPNTWKDTTYSDVKWLARRMARIRTEQIDTIMSTSGFPAPAQLLYREKIKSRLNKMMIDFDLLKEGFQLHPVLTKEDLQQAFPEFINDKGYLKEGAQQYPGNTLPIMGESFTPLQGAIILTINSLQNKFLTLFNPANYAEGQFTTNLGQTTLQGGLGFAASRDVSVNPEIGPDQRRYLLKDTLSISIPVGFFNDRLTTPIGLHYTYTFEYLHSVSTMKEVGTSRFFALLNPFSILSIRRTLGPGEQLSVTHSLGASVGVVKMKATANIEIEAALLGLGFTQIKKVYFSKPHPTILEASTDHIKTASVSSGIDIRTYLRFAAHLRAQRTQKVYRIYRIDLLNATPEIHTELQDAFDTALIDNDFSKLEAQVTPNEWIESNKSKSSDFAFFVWNRSKYSDVGSLRVNGTPLIVAHKSLTVDRAFSRAWNDKVTIGFAEPAANYLGNFWGEGKHIDLAFEGTVLEKPKRFGEMEFAITLSMFDNYCTREEFDEDFKVFFNRRSGSNAYIRFDMPPELVAYPELNGTMRWQLSARALRDILIYASNKDNLDYLVPGGGAHLNRPEHRSQDPRVDISDRARRLLSVLDNKSTTENLETQAKNWVELLNQLIGNKGLHIGRLRKMTKDENIWVTTNIANMLDLSHPTFRQSRGQFWAPEIGRHQGHSFLNRFRRGVLLSPSLRD